MQKSQTSERLEPSKDSGPSYLDLSVDVDSHEMVPLEYWGEVFDEQVASEIVQAQMGFLSDNGRNTLSRPDISGDLSEITEESVWNVKGPEAPGAIDFTRRVDVLDAMGVSLQLVYPTFGLLGINLFINPQAHRFLRYEEEAVDRIQLGRRIVEAHNRWAGRVTRESGDRVRPVAVILTDTIPHMMEQAEEALAQGVRAVMIPSGCPPAHTSPGDRALDPFWRLCAEANVPVTTHVGTEFAFLASHEWSVNVPEFEPLASSSIELPFEPYRATTMHFSAENWLCAMTVAGVFERHPGLRFGAIELSAGWIGPLADRLDCWVEQFASRLADTLSLRPSEYLARNVRVTPFFFEPVDQYLERYPDLSSVYCFSTDYPHLEGGRDAKHRFSERLSACGDDVREKFFVGNGSTLLPA
jgi:predicted TIM-barrel fold metal-dependent hydrolase